MFWSLCYLASRCVLRLVLGPNDGGALILRNYRHPYPKHRRRGRRIALPPELADLLARVEHTNTRAPHLIRWLLDEHLAEQAAAGLVATAKTRELAAGPG